MHCFAARRVPSDGRWGNWIGRVAVCLALGSCLEAGAARGIEPCASGEATVIAAGSQQDVPRVDSATVQDQAGQEFAQPPFQDAGYSTATMDDVVRRLEALEKAAKPADKKPDAEKKPDDGWLDLSTEKWTVKLGGHLQQDYVNWVNPDEAITDAKDYFEFRRARLLAEGAGYGVYDFRIQIDVEPEADSESGIDGPYVELKDAYLTIHEVEYFGRLRWGNFFVPFSLEQVTNDTNSIFLERSIPTQGIFAADREVGMAAYNASDDQNVAWSYGIFFDSISEGLKERIDNNQGFRTSGRLTWLPYYDEPSNGRYLVHTGVGVLYTHDQNDEVRFRARPQIHEGPRLIDSGVLDAGSYTVGNVELATVLGPFSVQSELFATNINLNEGDSANVYGAYVYASYFLTGENRQYDRFGQHGAQFNRAIPYTNFFCVPGGHGSGAWEAKARMSYLDLDNVDGGQYHDVTVGFNWYWSERIRVMFDWIHPITTAATVFGATTSDIVGTRLDFNF
jgi:phosphate-selective porin OprO/OprP